MRPAIAAPRLSRDCRRLAELVRLPRSPGLIALLVGTVAIGCGSSREVKFEELFSPVYHEFKSELLWGDENILSDQDRTSGSWNPVTRRGSYQIHGILTVDADGDGRGEVLRLIEEFVKSKAGYHIEGDLPSAMDATPPGSYTLFMYNWRRRHGEIQVWLFRPSDAGRIAFAVRHYEEDLK